jgi:hypothetical protein
MTTSVANRITSNAGKSSTVAKWRLLRRFGILVTGCYNPPEEDCVKTTE